MVRIILLLIPDISFCNILTVVQFPFPVDHTDAATLKRQAEEAMQKVLAKRYREEPERILSYVSKSHAFSDTRAKGRIAFGQNFFFKLVEPVDSTAFGDAAPKFKEDENRIHHPYFLREVAKLVNSALAAGRHVHQQLLWTKAGHWLSLDDRNVAGVEPDFSTTAVDTSRKNGDMSQFYVGRPEEGSEKPSKYDAVLAFEQKKAFVEADQIEAIDYAERILRIQRGRGVVYAALFHCCENEKIIRWMKVTSGDGHYVTEVSRHESLAPEGLGQRQLLTMLSKTSEELGRDFPNLGLSDAGNTIKISSRLGFGATADVYLGSVGNDKGVLKVLKNDFKHLAVHEADILRHLISADTPFLSNCSKIKDGILFFDEVLSPVRALTPRHVACLLQCLRHAHEEARVVHRDFRPDNIMETADGEIRIIDWGFAHHLDAIALRFEGTFRFACDEVLDAAINGAQRIPEPKDDLESFLRVVFAMTDRLLWKILAGVNDGGFAVAKQLWQQFKDENPRQADMFNAAARLDYEALKGIVPGLHY